MDQAAAERAGLPPNSAPVTEPSIVR
jgi:hypothetical protein